MKKLFLTTIFLMLIPIHAMGAWTVSATLQEEHGGYFWLKAVCTSDGSAMTATSLFTSLANDVYKIGESIKMLHGAQGRILIVDPGTGAVAPNTTIDITVTNENSHQWWADTGISYTADSTHTLWADTGDLMPIVGDLKIAISDIGDSGDQVTLYFLCVK